MHFQFVERKRGLTDNLTRLPDVGVPDWPWVRLRKGEEASEDELRTYCRGQIASYKIPRYIRFTTDFPTTVTGKIQKFRMREISIAELGLSQAEAVKTA